MPYRGPKRRITRDEIKAVDATIETVADDLKRLERLMRDEGVEEIEAGAPTDIVARARSLVEYARTVRNAWISRLTGQEEDARDGNAAALLPIGLASLKPNTAIKKTAYGGFGAALFWLCVSTSTVVPVDHRDDVIISERRSPMQRLLGLTGSERIVSDTTGRVLHQGPLRRGVAHGEWTVWFFDHYETVRFTNGQTKGPRPAETAARIVDPYSAFTSSKP